MKYKWVLVDIECSAPYASETGVSLDAVCKLGSSARVCMCPFCMYNDYFARSLCLRSQNSGPEYTIQARQKKKGVSHPRGVFV